MSVPGAENPDKVKNIVAGPGNLRGFRRMYGGLLERIPGVRWEDGKVAGIGGIGGIGGIRYEGGEGGEGEDGEGWIVVSAA
jgi:translocator assembly and maintenance protein 41